MKVLHIVPGLDDITNGMAMVVRFFAKEQGEAEVMDLNCAMQEFGVLEQKLKDCVEEVWVHGMWLPKEWTICWRVLRAGKLLVRMTHGSLSPVYLKQQGRWKKWLVGPIERYFLRRCEKIVATCDAEKEWIEAYLGKKCPEIVVEDLKRFFKLGVRSEGIRPLRVLATHRDASKPSDREAELGVSEGGFGFRVSGSELERDENNSQLTTYNSQLNLLYLGRRHPLKGVEFLEAAVSELHSSNPPLPTPPLLKIVSNAFGEEKERVWDWCDVLVLPTLSENYGLVVAEALERGKRVITTDGAPVWECLEGGSQELGFSVGYGGRLIYLKGYRDGGADKRIELLKKAIAAVSSDVMIKSLQGV